LRELLELGSPREQAAGVCPLVQFHRRCREWHSGVEWHLVPDDRRERLRRQSRVRTGLDPRRRWTNWQSAVDPSHRRWQLDGRWRGSDIAGPGPGPVHRIERSERPGVEARRDLSDRRRGRVRRSHSV